MAKKMKGRQPAIINENRSPAVEENGVGRQPAVEEQMNFRAPSAEESPTIGRHLAQAESKYSDDEFLKKYMEENPELVDPNENELPTQEEKSSMVDTFIKGVEYTGLPAVGQGVLKATQELGNFAMDVSNWTEEFGQMIGIGDDEVSFKESDKFTFADDPNLVYQPDTMAGKLVSGIAQFLAPAGALGKMSKGVKAVTKLGQFAKSGAIGAAVDFAAFDPKEERLSNLIQTQPMLRNPINAYLASNPKDTEAEGRFKNMVEGFGIGVAAEGLLLGLKAIRHSRYVDNVLKDSDELAKRAEAKGLTDELPAGALPEEVKAREDGIAATKAEIKAERPTQQPDLFEEVSAPEVAPRELTDMMGTTEKDLDAILKGKEDIPLEEKAGRLNVTTLETAEDAQKLISATAERFKGEIDEASRGVITAEESRKLADDLGMTYDDLVNRRAGQAFNAEEVKAARKILASSAEVTSEILGKITKDSTPAEKINAMMALDRHRVVQSQVTGAAAEAGRALQAHKDVLKAGGATKARYMQDLLKSFGGEDGILEVAERVRDFGAKEMNNVVRKSVGRHIGDVTKEVFINGLLSGPWTHIYNGVSNTSVVMSSIAERKMAEMFSKGAVDGVAHGEAKAMYTSLMGGLRDGIRAGIENWKTGVSQFGSRKYEYTKAISSKEFGMDENSVMSSVVDFLGTMNRWPTRFLESSDEVYKMVNFRMEIGAQAHRKASRAKIAQNLTDEEALEVYKDALVNYSDDIKMEAMEFARENTFTKDLEKVENGRVVPNVKTRIFEAAATENFIKKSPFLRIVAPFTKTNLNLVEYALNRTPLAVGLRDELAAGGARAATAKARIGTGMAAFSLATAATVGGTMTGGGPSDHRARKALEATGWKPYTLTIPGTDTKIPLNRLEPVGSIICAAADLAEIIGSLGSDREQDAQDIAMQTAAVFSHFMAPEFLLEGVNDFLDAIDGDQKKLDRITGNLGSALIPQSSMLRTARKLTDPALRETKADPNSDIPQIMEKMVNSIKNTIPGLSGTLPPRKNIFGEIETYRSWYLTDPDDESPFAADVKEDAVVKEIKRMNMVGPQAIDGNEALDYLKIDKPPRYIRKSMGGQSVTVRLSPEQYDRFVGLSAGIGLQSAPEGKTLREFLSDEIEADYPAIPGEKTDEAKRLFIQKVISDYRKAAREELMMEDVDIEEQFIEGAEKKFSKITGEDISLSL